VLNIEDIQTHHDRPIMPGTGYPEGERFTLQLIEIRNDFDRSGLTHSFRLGRDAAFSVDTDAAKPSGVLLHYNYGTAAVKWWGHHTDILRSPGPPHPPSPPPPHPPRGRGRGRGCGRGRGRSPPAAGPSTTPRYLRLPPKTVNDRTISIKKRERPSKSRGSKKKGADETMNEPKVWESWDEDDWMLYYMLNTKAARERQQGAAEESASNIRAWAQEVSGHQSVEL
jgi:hypothetical protein